MKEGNRLPKNSEEKFLEACEELNHIAYNDVLDGKMPTLEDNYYKQCYRFWRSLSNHPNFNDEY